MLTDDDARVIVSSPSIDAETLARQERIKATTVRNARARFRRKGWTCHIAYVHCHPSVQMPTTIGENCRSRFPYTKDCPHHHRRQRACNPITNSGTTFHRFEFGLPLQKPGEIKETGHL